MIVGVLALQGDVAEHERALERVGVSARRIRVPADLEGISALVLPGGESTTILMMIDSSDLRAPLTAWIAEGRPTLGTCAGLVLLADRVIDGRSDQVSLGGLGVTVQRNGFGRQRFSFEAPVSAPTLGADFDGVFIRAPRIIDVDAGTEVLGSLLEGDSAEPVLVQRGALLGCAFHPELSRDDRLHQRLVGLV